MKYKRYAKVVTNKFLCAIYERTKIESKDFMIKPFGKLFAVTVEDGDNYATT